MNSSSTQNLMENMKYYSNDFWKIYAVKNLPNYPWQLILIIALYLYFVKIYGPKMMRNRKAMDLKWAMVIHNTLLIIINLSVIISAADMKSMKEFIFECREYDMKANRNLLNAVYIYYISKYVDFLDTIFFVLRKKDSQITTLHVFHHAVMPFLTWICIKFFMISNGGLVPIINSCVHIVMYSYYCLSIFPKLRPYLGWKKYLTRIQLIQFAILIIHSSYHLVNKDCDCNRYLLIFLIFQNSLFFLMFLSFYLKSYKRSKTLKAD